MINSQIVYKILRTQYDILGELSGFIIAESERQAEWFSNRDQMLKTDA